MFTKLLKTIFLTTKLLSEPTTYIRTRYFHISIIVVITLSFLIGTRTTTSYAQTAPSPEEAFAQCIAEPLANYITGVTSNVNSGANINLLTPAFNGTSSTFTAILNALYQQDPNVFSNLQGLAMNVYQTAGVSVSQFLQDKANELQSTNPALANIISNMSLYITETGLHTGDAQSLANDLNNLIQSGNPLAGQIQDILIFNPDGTNPDPRFQYNLQEFCSQVDCSQWGNNSASFFGGSASGNQTYLAIADASQYDQVNQAIRDAHANGGKVIIRIGVGSSAHGFQDPADYAAFLNQLAADNPGIPIYAIAGPNEPDLEPWVAPECGQYLTTAFAGYQCELGEQPGAENTSRPAECATCIDYVPEPVRSCAGNFVYSRQLVYSAFNTMNCGNQQCSLDLASCGLYIGDTAIANADSATLSDPQNQLLVGPLPWQGRFTLNTQETVIPYVGNDTEESREFYIADYMDGTHFYRTPIAPGSSVPPASQDPLPIYSASASNYYDLPPTDPRYFSYAGVHHKLASQEYLDELKHQIIDRVDQTSYATTYQPIENYTIQNWLGETVKLREFNQVPPSFPGMNLSSYRRPLRSSFSSNDTYLEALLLWESLDGGKWARLWPYVPIASRQDTPGEFNPQSESPSVVLDAEYAEANGIRAPDSAIVGGTIDGTQGGKVYQPYISGVNNTVEPLPDQVEMQLPHLARLFESARIVHDLLAPDDSAVTALNPNQAGTNTGLEPGICTTGGTLAGQIDPATNQVTTAVWTNSTSLEVQNRADLADLLSGLPPSEIVTISGTIYTVDPITYSANPGEPVDPTNIGLINNICRAASSGCGGSPNGPGYELFLRFQGLDYSFQFMGNGATHTHKTYNLQIPKNSEYQIKAGLSACYSLTETPLQPAPSQNTCENAFVYHMVSNNAQPYTWCGVTDNCDYPRPDINSRDTGLGDSGQYWAENCGLPDSFWSCSAPPTIQNQSNCPANPLTSQTPSQTTLAKSNIDTVATITPTPIQLASSQTFGPATTTEPRILAQASSYDPNSVPPQCQTSTPGCYPPGPGGQPGCFQVSMEVDSSVSGPQLHYGIRAQQTCSTAGPIGDCYWTANGATSPMVRTIGTGPGGTFIHSTYNHGGALPPVGPVGPGDSGTIVGTIRCDRDISNYSNCCPQTQTVSCNFDVQSDGTVATNCTQNAAPPSVPAAPAACEPTQIGSVSQCSGILRPGPGDKMCGVQTFDLIIDSPDERFWNENPYQSVAVDNTGSLIGDGDGAADYTSNYCGAAVTCANCACAPPNQMVTLPSSTSCTTTYSCPDGRSGADRNYVCGGGPNNHPPCAGGCTTTRTCPSKCCAPNPADTSPNPAVPLNASNTDCAYFPPGARLCPNGGACQYDDGTSACVAQPYGSPTVIGDDRNGTGASNLSAFQQTLLYTAQREVHVSTNLPYLGAIYEDLIGGPTAVYKMFTPMRDETTAPDDVPWFPYHDGNASGYYQVENFGGAGTAINGAQVIPQQPFFFPYLGGIQDGTQFVRDCLTATWPNGCTPPDIRDLMTGKTCVANLSGKMSIYIAGYDGLASQFIQTVQPTVVKLMDSTLSQASQIKTLSPSTQIVGRIFSTQYDTNLPETDPASPNYVDPIAAANSWFSSYQGQITGSSDVDYWEGYNEPVVDSAQKMDWLAKFEAERVRLLASVGEQACIGNFSTGNPDPLLWTNFQPAIQAALNNGGVMCLHEYATSSTTVDGNRMGRFQQMYNALETLDTANGTNLATIQTIISETGASTNGASTGGWRVIYNNDEERFLQALQEYDQAINAESRIIGATIFIYNHPGWPNQEIGPDIVQALIDGSTAAPEGQVQCVDNSVISDPQNENITINKQAFINDNGNLTPVPDSIPNSSLPVTITYQVEISTQLPQLDNIFLTNRYEVSQDPQTAPIPNPSFPTPPAGLVITPGTPYTFSYDHTFSNQYQDSLVTDTITLRSGPITDSGNASVVFGNPPQDCPAGWPVTNTAGGWTFSITQGPWASYSHSRVNAIDIASGSTPQIIPANKIIATHRGRVVVKNFDSIYGLQVRIEGQCNGHTITTVYGHMDSFANTYNVGDTVNRGTILGVMGTTGSSSGIHVHYEFRPGRGAGLYMRPPFLPRNVPDYSEYSGTFTAP